MNYSNASTVATNTTLTVIPKAFIPSTTGNVAVVTLAANSAETVIPVVAGTIYPIRIKRLNSANTTAGIVIGLY